MHRTVRFTHRERRLLPAFRSVRGQMIQTQHRKQSEQRRLTLPRDHRAPAHNPQPARSSGGLDPVSLLMRKYTCEPASQSEVPGGGLAIILDAPTRLKPACDFLRMIAMNAASKREVWGASKDQIKLLLRVQNPAFTEITEPYLEAIAQPVVRRRFSRQSHTFGLCLNSYKPCAGETPRGHHRDAAYTASQVQNTRSTTPPRGAVPGEDDIIRREPMPPAQLVQPKMPADRVQRFVRPQGSRIGCHTRRHRTGPSPSAKKRRPRHVLHSSVGAHTSSASANGARKEATSVF